MDELSMIIDYENGILNEGQVYELFQQLVNSGLVWQLQGSYGRMASDLIQCGFIKAAKRNRVKRELGQ